MQQKPQIFLSVKILKWLLISSDCSAALSMDKWAADPLHTWQAAWTNMLSDGWGRGGVGVALSSPQCGCCSSVQGLQLTSHSCWGLMTERCTSQQRGHFLNSTAFASNWFWHSDPHCLSHSQLRKKEPHRSGVNQNMLIAGNSEWPTQLMKREQCSGILACNCLSVMIELQVTSCAFGSGGGGSNKLHVLKWLYISSLCVL